MIQLLQLLWAFADDPNDGDLVVPLVTTLGRFPPFGWHARRHASTAPDREAVTREPIEDLSTCAPGTLGYDLRAWYRRNGHTTPPEAVRDAACWLEMDPWPLARFYKVHDLHHVLTGVEPTPEGEIELQALLRHAGQPNTLTKLSVFSSPLLALRGCGLRALLRAEVTGWLRGHGLNLEDLVMFPFEDHWHTPTADVRAMVGL